MQEMSDRELLKKEAEDRVGLLESGFFAELSKKNRAMVDRINSAKPGVMTVTASSKDNTKTNSTAQIAQTNVHIEKILINLFEIRDGLVSIFENLGINHPMAQYVSKYVNLVGNNIRVLGGDIEDFSPIDHVSGLTMPNLVKNAERVIETTRQCYSFGNVDSSKISDNGKEIELVFAGTCNDVKFSAKGAISPKNCWTGNEAIDYIYTKSSGKMFVRIFDEGRWIDKSNNYNISWELTEEDIKGNTENNIEKNSSKDNLAKESQINKENNKEEVDKSFPIIDKENKK